jgi:hypothetical protein
MASTKISFPKYRLHRGSGQAFVQIKGKRHYLGVHDSQESKEAYSRFIAELSANPSASPLTGFDPIGEKLTVVELCAAYLDYVPGYYQKNGIPTRQVDHIKTVIKQLVALYGSISAEEFGPRALKTLRQTMIDKGWCRGYINAQVKLLKKLFKWACSEEILPASVYHALSTVEGLAIGRSDANESLPILPVTDAVVNATLPYLPAVVADMVRL